MGFSVIFVYLVYMCQLHVNKPRVLWIFETKAEMCARDAQRHIWQKPSTAYQHKNLYIQPIMHSSGVVMIQAGFKATGRVHLVVMELTMNYI